MKRTYMSRFMIAVLLLGNSALIMPMEENQPAPQAVPAVAQEECTVCISDDIPVDQMRQLVCGHRYCVGCLGDKLELALNDQDILQARRNLHCPSRGCQHEMNEIDIRAITGDEAQVARFTEIMLRLQTGAPAGNVAFANCPTPNCPGLYPVEQGEARWPVLCAACNEQYCSQCQRQHEPGEDLRMIDWCFCAQCNQQHEEGQPCPVAALPVQNNNNAQADAQALRLQEEERQNREWIRQNTRPCPRCHVNIQKNLGCNHMTCRNKNCGFEFCFECLVEWRNLGAPGYEQFRINHEGYYNCRAPRVEDDALDALRAVEPVRAPAPRPVPGIAGDMTPEEIEAAMREFVRLEQGNNNGGNNQNPIAPGNRFRAQAKPSNVPMIIEGVLITAAVAGTVYGCYKLYQYFTTPKPGVQKDLKAAIADLHKEAIRGKNLAQNSVYMRGSVKNYFSQQVKAGSFAALTPENVALLTAQVDAFENALSAQGDIDQAYVAFVRTVSSLILESNNPAQTSAQVETTPVVVEPAVDGQVKPFDGAQDRQAAEKKQIIKKPGLKRPARAKRVK